MSMYPAGSKVAITTNSPVLGILVGEVIDNLPDDEVIVSCKIGTQDGAWQYHRPEWQVMQVQT
jgi:hypothetical protein